MTSPGRDTVKFNCDPAAKRRWVDSAWISDVPFEQWATRAMDAAAMDTNPAWAHGLSDRARLALLAGRFFSRDQVAVAAERGYPFYLLPNAGRRAEREILGWLER